MSIEPREGWAIARPWQLGRSPRYTHVLVCRPFTTRFEAMQYVVWGHGLVEEMAAGSMCPWFHTDQEAVRRAWKKLYREGYRAVRVITEAQSRLDQLRPEDDGGDQ